MRIAVILILVVAIPQDPATPEGDPERLQKMVAAVNVEDTPSLLFPGEGFANLPATALPVLKDQQKRKDLRWPARACIAKAIRSIEERQQGLGWATEYEARRSEFKRLLSGEYRRVSRRSPAWDRQALDAVEGCAGYWGSQQYRRPEDAKRVLELAKVAIAEGCDDPLVLYISARMLQDTRLRSPMEILEAHEAAANALDASAYHPLLRAHSLKTLAQQLQMKAGEKPTAEARKEILDHLKESVRLFSEALETDPKLTREFVLEQFEEILNLWAFYDDREKAFKPIHAAAHKAQPESPLADLLMGSFEIHHAWDARGGGWASEVGPEAWEKFKLRLQAARKALETAWEKDPTSVLPSSLMMPVTMGDGSPREEMEKWFERGVQAFPDKYALYEAKLYYLEPKWHGSSEEMLRFGRQCALAGNWSGSIPWILQAAHRELAHYTAAGWQQNEDMSYYARPEVWADLRDLYSHYLRVYPNDAYARASFAYFCGYARHLKEADEQFRVIGDSPTSLGLFGSRAQFDQARRAAAAAAREF